MKGNGESGPSLTRRLILAMTGGEDPPAADGRCPFQSGSGAGPDRVPLSPLTRAVAFLGSGLRVCP